MFREVLPSRAVTRRRLVLAGGAGLAVVAGTARPARAQPAPYPSRQVRMVVAFPPGGPTDIVSRVLATRLTEQLGQSVFVDNKPGAGGNIAADMVAKAAPDGYTIFYNTSAITIAPALYGKVPYDTLKDFEPVSSTAAVPMVVMVHPSLPVRNISELIAYARAHPDKLNYSSSGTGTVTHLATAALCAHAGITMQHIPYKGSAPGLADLAAGNVQVMTDTLNSSMAFIREGRVRALAITTMKRSAVMPELPTLNETAMPGMEMSAWQGVVAPAGTPRPIIDKLNAEILKALQSDEVKAKLAAQGTDVLGSTPQAYRDYIRSELARWSKIVKDTGAKAE